MSEQDNQSQANNQSAGGPSVSTESVFSSFPSASLQGQPSNEAPAGEAKNEEGAQQEALLGKFKSQEELVKAYEELERSHTQTRQELSSMKDTSTSQAGQQSPPQQQEPEQFLNFESLGLAQAGQYDANQSSGSSLYPSTNHMLEQAVQSRLGVLAQEMAKQINPVIGNLNKQVGELKQQLAIADSRTVTATVFEEFPEMKTDEGFKQEVQETMKAMQTQLKVDLQDAHQFGALLRNAAYSVRGKRGQVRGNEEREELNRAGQLGMKTQGGSAPGTKKGQSMSDADAIRQGVLDAGKPRNSIF